MPTPAWPVSVPAAPLQGGYSESQSSNLSKFQPDVGPPSVWRRSVMDSARIDAAFRMTASELASFLNFYREDLEEGALSFTWVNPVYGAPLLYRFDPEAPPQWSDAGASIGGQVFHVKLAVFRLEGGA